MNTIAVKVVIDTNILMAIIGKRSPYRWIFDAIISCRIRPCLSNEILSEYLEILTLKNGYNVADGVAKFLTISPCVQRSEIYYSFNYIIDDPDDNKYVDCAIATNADFILSNDNHFQVLKTIDFPKVNVLTLPEFEIKYKRDLTPKNK